MTNLTKYEMETVVNYNAAEQIATVYTRDKSVMPEYYLCQEFCRQFIGVKEGHSRI